MYLVSVVIPTYGRPEQLERAISSVLAQTYKQYEIIVVDDNNPDTEDRKLTERIMEKYMAYPNVQYIRHDCNKNGAAARNTGIFAAKGDWIAFLDDDDLFLPQKLEKQADFIEHHPQFSGVYCWYTQRGMKQCPRSFGDLTADFLMCRQVAPTPTLFLKKAALLEINGFDESFVRHQDIEMMLRFFEKNEIAPVAQVLTEIGCPDGKNQINGKELEVLKDKFLSCFSASIAKQPKRIQKRIYCANYASVWASYIHRRRLREARRIFFRWAGRYPATFVSECVRLVLIYLKNRYKK